MAKQRTAGITIIAILNMIFGVLGLSCTVTGYLIFVIFADAVWDQYDAVIPPTMQIETNGYTQREFLDYLAENYPNWDLEQNISWGLEVLLSLLLIASAIGLWRMASSGRWLTILYAVVNIAYRIYSTTVMLVYGQPVARQFFQEVVAPRDPSNPPTAEEVDALAFLAVGPMGLGNVMFLIYPLLVLIIMLLPSVGRAFRGEPTRVFLDQDDE